MHMLSNGCPDKGIQEWNHLSKREIVENQTPSQMIQIENRQQIA